MTNQARRGFERPVIATQNMSPLTALNIAVGAADANRVYEINLNDVIVDQEIQVRVGGLDAETLSQYIAVLENEGELPPITVFRDDAGEHYLADGFHRFRAHEVQGRAIIKAFVRDGNRSAAIEYAESANLEHGLKLTHEDKKNILYRRVERGHEWASWSTRELGRVLGVSYVTIKRWIDDYATVTNVTVERTEIKGADGRVIKTGNIGKSPRKPDDGYVPMTPEERKELSQALPVHHSMEHIDTGDGQASAILSDELAARHRESVVIGALEKIAEGTGVLKNTVSLEILREIDWQDRVWLLRTMAFTIGDIARLTGQVFDSLPGATVREILEQYDQADNRLAELRQQMRGFK